MTVNEVVQILEKRFPPKQAEDFDNVGLLCGRPAREVTGILISHDTTLEVVEEAIETGKNFILSFHPIIFSGLKSLKGKNYVEQTVLKALENGIAIYAVHTVFDNDYMGVNAGIADKLGLKNQKILLPKQNNLKCLEVYVPKTHTAVVQEALFAAGAGNIGFYEDCSFTTAGIGSFRPLSGADPYSGTVGKREYSEEEAVSVVMEEYKIPGAVWNMKKAHPYEEVAYQITNIQNENTYSGLGRYGDLEEEMEVCDFLVFVRKTFNLPLIRYSKADVKTIKRVGVLGGSGAFAVQAGISAGCEAFLTGDLKYHDFFQGSKMMICDIGHFESEQFVVDQLFKIISEIFPKFAVSKTAVNTNPVNYFV